MCTGTELMLVAGGGLGAVGSALQGGEASRAYGMSATQADIDAAAEIRAGEQRAEKTRKAGRYQKSAARAALAKSGVSADAGSALEVQEFIEAGAEEDALNEILTGEARARKLREQARMDRRAASGALISGVLGAGKSLLFTGYELSRSRPGWKVQQDE